MAKVITPKNSESIFSFKIQELIAMGTVLILIGASIYTFVTAAPMVRADHDILLQLKDTVKLSREKLNSVAEEMKGDQKIHDDLFKLDYRLKELENKFGTNRTNK